MLNKTHCWDPSFYKRSPLFAPLIALALQLNQQDKWPSVQDYTDFLRSVTNQQGKTLQCVADIPVKAQSAPYLGYEQQVYLNACLPTRLAHWHDYFNALVWRLFPKTKASLNARQFTEFEKTQSLKRTDIQQCFAHFDETGVLIICHCPILADLLLNQRWYDLFYIHRQAVIDNMQWIIVGHGLYEKLLDPYIGITGKGILLCDPAHRFANPVDITGLDQLVCEYINTLTEKAAKKRFVPVPLLGIPNVIPRQTPDFYHNTAYFRAVSCKIPSAWSAREETLHVIDHVRDHLVDRKRHILRIWRFTRG